MSTRSATSLTTMAVLVWACLVLGVSSSRIAVGSGLSKQQQEASATSAVVAESFTTSLRRSLQWWKDPLGVGDDGDDDDDDEEDDKRRNDDDDDDGKDDNNQCAERDERSRECGASDSFPRKCCGSLVCDPSGTRCKREGDIEEKEEVKEEETQVKACADPGERSQACGGGGATPETCCGANTCNMETIRCEALECSLLGMRSQQCGGGGALPVTCCGDLVCNESNRCDDPANAGNAQDDAPMMDDGEEDADLSTCASDGDRAIECGATNPTRPQKCCPGHICSNDASLFARCVKDPTSGGPPGTDIPVTPDIPLTPAPTPTKMTGEPAMGATLEPTGAGGPPGTDIPVTPDIPLTPAPTPTKMTGEPAMGATLEPTGAAGDMVPTSEPTLEPSLEPTKDEANGLLATSGATVVAGGAIAAGASAFVGALFSLF